MCSITHWTPEILYFKKSRFWSQIFNMNKQIYLTSGPSLSLFLTSSLSFFLSLFNSPAWCKALFVLFKTFRLCNYFWMLNEGWYLHKLIVAAFSEQTKTRYFHIVAW